MSAVVLWRQGGGDCGAGLCGRGGQVDYGGDNHWDAVFFLLFLSCFNDGTLHLNVQHDVIENTVLCCNLILYHDRRGLRSWLYGAVQASQIVAWKPAYHTILSSHSHI